ncbi:MAG TPA: hypothetical protein P5043_03935 [Candidatus Paceibacterota bacterium]|nr:hypothetical protein [Candidatus Paceibacterota bacterium]
MSTQKIKKVVLRSAAVVTIMALVSLLLPANVAFAGELENEKDTMTRVKTAETSSHTIVFNLSASNTFAAGETITIDFNEDSAAGFTVAGAASAIADFDFNDGTERTIYSVGVGAPSCTNGTDNIGVGIDDTTGIVTFQACTGYTASGAGAVVTIEYGTAAGGTNRVTNKLSQNDLYIAIGGTNGDSGGAAVSIIADDQVVVTATVNPTFTFVLSSNTCALGVLTSSSVASCNYNVTTTTNSEDGYATTIIEDGDLRDGSSSITDVADGTVTAGATEYGIGLTGTDRSFSDERAITGTAQTIAADTSGPISAQAVTVTHKASITSAVLAGAYSHTVTLISTGTF